MFAQIPYEMKQALTLFISGISFLFWTSCSTQQALVSTTKHTKQQPRFLEDVTLQHQVSNTRNIKQEKQIYQNEQDDPALVITSESNALNINSTKNLYDFIEEWYGVPYRMGGTTKKGIDCSAFVQELYGEVYQTNIVRTSREQFATCHYIGRWTDLQEGDLVFFKIRTREISHVGVYLGEGKFVHASRSRGVVISSLNSVYWTRYYAGGGRVAG